MKAILQFIAECAWFAVPMSLVFVLLSLPLMLLKARKQIALFLACLLFTSSLCNGLWSALVWNRRYYSTDYIFDFSPFWPITQGVLDARFGEQKGYLIDVTLTQLNMIWFTFALLAWTTAFFLLRFISKHWKKTKSEPSDSANLATLGG